MKKPFTPQPLPITLSDSEIIKLLQLATNARVKIERFNTMLERSIISDSVLMYFSMHESLESTRIEGTQATFSDVMEAEITGNRSNDVQEVINYLKAIHYGKDRLKSLPISTRLFHELHSIILQDSRGQNRSPGEFRKIQNFIGPTSDIKDASYIPPEPQRLPEYISNLEAYINGQFDDPLDILIRAGIIHAQFETIHPYLDGNGRLGRILIILYLLDNNIISKPSFFLSEELEKNKYKYYGLLNNLRGSTPQWYIWLEFFLNSTIRQADRSMDKLMKIEQLHAAMIALASQSDIRSDLVDFIFKKSFFTISDVQSALDISYNTASKHVARLVDTGRVFADDKRRNRIYRFYDIFDILNG